MASGVISTTRAPDRSACVWRPCIALLSPHLKTDTRHMERDSSDQVQRVPSTTGWRIKSRGVTYSQNERHGLDLSLERKTWV